MKFQKGHKFAKGRIAGSKNKTTLLMEERRAMFENEVSAMWLKTIQKLPPTYIADQFMGKAPDEVNVTAAVTTSTLSAEVIAEAKKLLKAKLTENE